jgi:4-diphosphocytidyl-2-C-methyl-D-erythritol kinase
VILEGRGERVRPAAPLPGLFALLVKPDLEIRAGDAYGFLDAARHADALTVDRAGATSIDAPIDAPGVVGRMLANDLQRGCVERFPALRRVLRGLGSLGSLGFAMSGSGPTCFALFSTRTLAERARHKFERSAHRAPGDWMAVTALRRGSRKHAG